MILDSKTLAEWEKEAQLTISKTIAEGFSLENRSSYQSRIIDLISEIRKLRSENATLKEALSNLDKRYCEYFERIAPLIKKNHELQEREAAFREVLEFYSYGPDIAFHPEMMLEYKNGESQRLGEEARKVLAKYPEEKE